MISLKQKVVFIQISKLFSKKGTLLEKSNLDEMVLKFLTEFSRNIHQICKVLF